MSHARLFLLSFAAAVSAAVACTRPQDPAEMRNSTEPPAVSLAIARIQDVLARVPIVLAKNYKTFAVDGVTVEGFGAGDAYPQIWLRDSAWIAPTAAAYYKPAALLSWLDLHLSVATKSGRLRDWIAPGLPENFRPWAPNAMAVGSLTVDTNSNESDQEPSAALAYCRVVEALHGSADVTGPAHEARVAKLIAAMRALIRDRTDKASGLIWSALTADWGDVSPMYDDQRAIYLDAKTPRTLALYSNATAFAALDCLSRLAKKETEARDLATRAAKLRDQIRTSFWDGKSGFFRMRIDLDPLPKGFEDDAKRFALGGNALAALYGVADDAQAMAVFGAAEALRVKSGARTISTTLVPPYPAGVFLHPAMKSPGEYQNGGEWDWFGAALARAECERGDRAHGLEHLDQIASRILKAGDGIHEWYARDGSAKGSASYAAAAASFQQAATRCRIALTLPKSRR